MAFTPDAALPGIAHYAFQQELGRGKFCVVHLAVHFYTQKKYAIKVIDKSAHKSGILSRLKREIHLVEALNHPNVAKIYEVIETAFTIYIVLEYVPGLCLDDYLNTHGRLSSSEAWPIFRQVVAAVSHCHSRSVVHRDVKPVNILISSSSSSSSAAAAPVQSAGPLPSPPSSPTSSVPTSPTSTISHSSSLATMSSKRVKLIDFGLGNVFSHRTRLNTICGSLPYYSPEIVSGSSYVGPEIDIWCLGVLLYRMVTNCDPFVADSVQDVKKKISRGQLLFPSYVDPSIQTTILTLLVADPVKRQSLVCLETDPWFTRLGLEPFVSEHRGLVPSGLSAEEEKERQRLSGATLANGNLGSKFVPRTVSSSSTTSSSSEKSSSMVLGASLMDKNGHHQRLQYGKHHGTGVMGGSTLGFGLHHRHSSHHTGGGGQGIKRASSTMTTIASESHGGHLNSRASWRIDTKTVLFRKNRVRILPTLLAESDNLYLLHEDLSLLQFLIPIFVASDISYYIHTTRRILCGASFADVTAKKRHQPSALLQKLVHHFGAAMTGINFQDDAALASLDQQQGVFSIDIVKGKEIKDGYTLIFKKLIGGSATTKNGCKQFLQFATAQNVVPATA